MPRRKQSDLRRRRPARETRRRILVVCEGRVTERTYFNDLRTAIRSPLVEVIVDDETGTPKTLVARAVTRKREAEREARSKKDSFLGFDEVWFVYDKDDHPYLAEARDQATG